MAARGWENTKTAAGLAKTAAKQAAGLAKTAVKAARRASGSRVALWGVAKARDLSDRAVSGLQDALLTNKGKVLKMRREYSNALDKFLKVQAWLETHSAAWLRDQLKDTKGPHTRIKVRAEDVVVAAKAAAPAPSSAASASDAPADASGNPQ
jgi:hypothetical protein